MWYRKHTYMRLDGSSKISERRDMVADFQTRSDIFVFLLSTRAGGLGINLTAADTVRAFSIYCLHFFPFLLSFSLTICRPAYLYRFSRDIPILALNHDFPISCGGVPILEDAGIFRAFRFRFVLFSPVFPNPPRILHLPPVKALRCRYK